MEKEKKVITFGAIADENEIILKTIDNSCGIKESDLIRVFEKGFTGSDRKKVDRKVILIRYRITKKGVNTPDI